MGINPGYLLKSILLPDFLYLLFLFSYYCLYISAYYVMLMANDIFILVSHHHWEQATKPLHIWCEQNWNLDQVLSAWGVSPELNLFLPFQCNCWKIEKQKKLGTILNYFRFFVVFWKYLHTVFSLIRHCIFWKSLPQPWSFFSPNHTCEKA